MRIYRRAVVLLIRIAESELVSMLLQEKLRKKDLEIEWLRRELDQARLEQHERKLE